jgi:D-beta-D-heptose 7-phosphate kinase/D-beta-D-heptose 1-phosphate adenosyltransferase
MSRIVCCSGGFDPLTSGHIDYIEDAANYGRVIVILNSDEWLIRKKGYLFMPWPQRAKILCALRAVYGVISVDDSDGSVSSALRHSGASYFANGGDRTADNTLELDVCRELGITPLFNIGGGKTASSSELVRAACRQMN